MKIVVDNKIPFIRGILEPYAKVVYLQGNKISNKDLIDADALIVRTRTRVSRELLEGTNVKFVGTATIGTDHIDKQWCNENNILWVSAPGCNSGSVMQYLSSSLIFLQDKYNLEPGENTIGIIGVGNVGSKVARMASLLGYNVLLNDPPREEKEGSRIFTGLDYLLAESDLVSLHVPLQKDGRFATREMVDKIFLSKMKKGAILINTSRGSVIKEEDLLPVLKNNQIGGCILDVWKNEPELDQEMLKLVDIGTAHIAGYSVDGKAYGTSIIVNKLASFFKLPVYEWFPDNIPGPDISRIKAASIGEAIRKTYRVEEDSNLLKSEPDSFEELRGNYRQRREFGAYTVQTENIELKKILLELGFKNEH